MSVVLLMDELAALGVELRAENGKLRFRAPEGVMSASLRERVAAARDALVARLSGRLEPDPELLACKPSNTQERLWFVHQMQGPNVTYNIPMRLRLKGPLDAAALRESVEGLLRRHQCLRCRFVHESGALRMEILRDIPAPWSEEDLSALPDPERERRLAAIADSVAGHCFDLSKAPLFLAKLVRAGGNLHELFFNVHHIAADGWSCALLANEIAAGYLACTGQGPAVADAPWKFTDYLDWQDYLRTSGSMDADLAFWRGKLEGIPETTSLPADRPRPEIQSFSGGTVPFDLEGGRLARLKARAREWGASLNHVLLAATAALVAERCEQDDIVLGMPLANRTRREIENVVGMMVNTVPLRLNVPCGARPGELVQNVREACNEALLHGNLPFEQLVGEAVRSRDLAQTPLFQIAYNFLPPMATHLPFGDIDAELHEFQGSRTIAKYDATFYYDETGGTLAGRIEYAESLYDRATVEGWGKALSSALTGMIERPDEPLRPAKARLAKDWKPQCVGPERDMPETSPWELFTRAAALDSDSPALVEENSVVSHAELKRRAEFFSALLARHGVTRGDRVGFLLPRGGDYVAAMLGTIRLGAAFVPFDASQPRERLLRMNAKARLAAFVCREGDDAEGTAPEILRVNEATWRTPVPGDLPAAADTGPEEPFYMIFTSGSTGEPKGVLVPWRGARNMTEWVRREYSLAPGDRLSQIASLSFDASVFEIWPALVAGCTLVFVPELERLDPACLRNWLIREKIAIHFCPTPLAEALVELDWPASSPLRFLATGGQTLHRRPKSGAPFRLLNCYGPTEASVLVTAGAVEPEGKGLPPIGRAIANTRLAVLDESGNLARPGKEGELYASGAGVALGYFDDEKATAKSFVHLPEDPSAAIWYRTGDLVRLRGDGRLDYLGRRDGQVKIRGFRIETGEVETALMRVPGVKTAVVRAEDGALAAYVECGDASLDTGEIRRAVAELLPAYMIPARIAVAPQLPRLASGKIDFRTLRPSEKVFTAPSSGLHGAQALVAQAWTEVLGIPAPGLDDNFFDIGGHSLVLVRLKDRIAALAGREIGLLDLFRNPTIRRQAAFLGEKDEPAGRNAEKPVRRKAAAGAPVAIVGMAGRFPEAENVAEFWKNLCEGRECIRFFTREELLDAGVPEALADNPAYVPANGILKDFDKFDAEFFGVPAREAEIMDPQQRLLLEEAWHCFEDAGIDPAKVTGRVGVYVGSSMNGYVIGNVLPRREIMEGVGGWAVMVANDKDFSATRISYKLNLRGPSVSVNTACSTSLVAVHQAVTALQAGQCEMALAGGSCVRSRQVDGYLYEDGGVLSKDGHCRAFDAEATGMVGGSAVALVLLKRLDDALEDGDPIHAVLRGISVNNDGSDKIGFTAPGIAGQSAVIADALGIADAAPESVGFVETHGTGTKLGDSIEVAALAANYAPGGSRPTPLSLGSLKTNVGHLDAAAGVAGLVKAALCLEHRTLVPSLHFHRKSPEIRWPGDAFTICTAAQAFPGPSPRRAAVSSLGIGGTNAHAILEEAPAIPGGESAADGLPHLLLLSGQEPRTLAANAETLRAWFAGSDGTNLRDAAHTLAFGRHHWQSRSALCAATPAEAAALLAETMQPFAKAARVAFLFTGMGTQKPGMARAPYEHAPVFRAEIDRCAGLLEPVLGLDIRRLLLADPADTEAGRLLDAHRVGQPAVFALEYALACFWTDLGIRPAIVSGHSLGEWVGATLAGVFDLEDALRLVSLRGKLMEEREKGAMLAVNLTEDAVAARLPEGLGIATINAPDQIVVAGPAAIVENFAQELERGEIRCKRLAVTLAAHSPLMEPLLPEFGAAIGKVRRHTPAEGIALVSDSTGAFANPAHLAEPAYWTEHLRRCVRFADCLATLYGSPDTALLECGPSHTLCNLALRDPRRPREQTVLASLDGGETAPVEEWKRMLESAGALWACGLPVDLDKLFALQGKGRRISLPGYAFRRKRHWLEEVAPTNAGILEKRPPKTEDERDEDDAPDAAVNATPPERRVIGLMRELLGNVRLTPASDFFLSGGDSLLAVRLASRIGEATGAKLTRAEVMRARTVAALARLIEENGAQEKSGEKHKTAPGADCLMRLWKGDEALRPIVLLHAVGGGIFIYRDLLRALQTSHPVWGLQSPGLWDDTEPPTNLRAQAELYEERLAKEGIDHPVMIGGSSYGGIVAYELEQIYHEKGRGGATIAMFDSPGPGHMPRRLGDEESLFAYLLAEEGGNSRFRAMLETIRTLDRDGREKLLLARLRETLLPGATETDLKRQLRVLARNLGNMEGWSAKPTRSRILFFKATEQSNPLLADSPELAWLPVAKGGITIVPSPGNHTTMLDDPNARFLAAELNRVLSLAKSGT